MFESQNDDPDFAWFLNFQNWVRKVHGIKPDNLTELPIETYKQYWADYLAELKIEQAKPKPKEEKRKTREDNTFALSTVRRNYGNGFRK